MHTQGDICDQISPDYSIMLIIVIIILVQAPKKTTFEEKEYKFYIESVSKARHGLQYHACALTLVVCILWETSYSLFTLEQL